VANVPYRMSATPLAAQPRVAGLGDDTEGVLRDALGLDAGTLASLRAKGAFGRARA